jgi:hypothetical protein
MTSTVPNGTKLEWSGKDPPGPTLQRVLRKGERPDAVGNHRESRLTFFANTTGEYCLLVAHRSKNGLAPTVHKAQQHALSCLGYSPMAPTDRLSSVTYRYVWLSCIELPQCTGGTLFALSLASRLSTSRGWRPPAIERAIAYNPERLFRIAGPIVRSRQGSTDVLSQVRGQIQFLELSIRQSFRRPSQ